MKNFVPFIVCLGLAATLIFSSGGASAHTKSSPSQNVLKQKIHNDVSKPKRAKLPKLKTKRHFHPDLEVSQDRGKHGAHTYNHRHGRFLSHTHRKDDFIHISPKARKWPKPEAKAGMVETLPLYGFLFSIPEVEARSFDVAVVVEEHVRGVTVIRNVKTFTSSIRDVREKKVIGSTPIPRPIDFLSEEEIEICNRRLRATSGTTRPLVVAGNTRYCQ